MGPYLRREEEWVRRLRLVGAERAFLPAEVVAEEDE